MLSHSHRNLNVNYSTTGGGLEINNFPLLGLSLHDHIPFHRELKHPSCSENVYCPVCLPMSAFTTLKSWNCLRVTIFRASFRYNVVTCAWQADIRGMKASAFSWQIPLQAAFLPSWRLIPGKWMMNECMVFHNIDHQSPFTPPLRFQWIGVILMIMQW